MSVCIGASEKASKTYMSILVQRLYGRASTKHSLHKVNARK